MSMSRPDRLSVILIVAALAASGPLPMEVAPWLGALVLVVFALGIIRLSPGVVHLGLVALLPGLLMRIPALGRLWPLPLVVFLLIYAVVVAMVPWLGRSPAAMGWLKRGKFTRTVWTLIVGFALVSAVSLVVWRFTTGRDLSSFRSMVPNVPFWLLPPGLLIFACLNAAFEELIWRGAVQHSLEGAMGSRWGACVVQAVAFGLWHFLGFPGGWAGVGLAAIFAFMMGALKLTSGGMLAPWLGHVVADVTIFGLVVGMVLV